MNRFRSITAAGAALAVAVAVLVPSAAEATPVTVRATTQYIAGGGSTINVRSGPSTTSPIVRQIRVGEPLVVQCQLEGAALSIAPYSRNKTWDKLAGAANEFVSDVVTTSRATIRIDVSGGYVLYSPDIDRCPGSSAAPGSGAAAWAASMVGRAIVEPADAAVFSDADWAPGPRGELASDCSKYVQLAWRHEGKPIATGNAVDLYKAYRDRVQQGAAPRGALVFWPFLTRFGHVAISDGAGGVYTTRGADGSYARVEQRPVGFFGTPAGWVLP